MRYFITGTDTDCGKTQISLALIQHCVHQGLKTVGMKPVAAGAHTRTGSLRNDDALALLTASNLDPPYELVNPYCFEPAIAPHIAAQRANDPIRFDVIEAAFEVLSSQSEALIVEGAGGWRAPLNDTQDMADLCIQLQLPVILVADVRLGWINHTLLSVESIMQRGIELAGWIANQRSPEMPCLQENIEALEQRIPAPLLGTVPHMPAGNPEQVKKALKVCQF